MENFFSYISKPVDKEDVKIWIESNDICYQKFELYHDFVSSLINLIYDTYLGDDGTQNSKIHLDSEDNKKHFQWCWNKIIENFKKEEINFKIDGEHRDFFENFIEETFYNQEIPEVRFSLSKFFNEIFNLDTMFTLSDLDLLSTIYKSMDKNLMNGLHY